jgi:subtilase family serine protease
MKKTGLSESTKAQRTVGAYLVLYGKNSAEIAKSALPSDQSAATKAIAVMESLGFNVVSSSTSFLRIEGPISLFEKVFRTKLVETQSSEKGTKAIFPSKAFCFELPPRLPEAVSEFAEAITLGAATSLHKS